MDRLVFKSSLCNDIFNLSGKSAVGVYKNKIGKTYVTVKFKNTSKIYIYNLAIKSNVGAMKNLASPRSGLI
jgi:hypothetical protein